MGNDVAKIRSRRAAEVLFVDRLDPDKALVVDDAADVNWPAWTEARKRS
jgi:hypothetical protein